MTAGWSHTTHASLWPDWLVRIRITSKEISERFQLWAHQPLVKRVPGMAGGATDHDNQCQPLVKRVPGMSRGSTDHDNQCSMWFLSPCHQHWVIVTKVINYPDSKIHGANIGPIWGRQDPGGPHVGPINFAIWVHSAVVFVSNSWLFFFHTSSN